jgi:indolepyruvate ferredoxin oxidoreductase beta subunit
MDKRNVTNIVIAGLGGQGVLKASDILADAAFRAGHDVKKAEVHGMSQRGGSVTSDVRYGDAVLSPMVPEGEADVLVALEASQVEPNRRVLRSEGRVLSAADIDVKTLPTEKALNVAMLGMLSAIVDLPPSSFVDAVKAAFPEKLYEANVQAFEAGRKSVQ